MQDRSTDEPVRVRDEAERGAFVARRGDTEVGTAAYQLVGEVVVLTHTEVDPAVEGQGVGSALVRAALDDVRGQGRRVVPQCPFVAAWIERHGDYADLVAG